MKVALKAFFAIIILLFGSPLMNITVQDESTKNIVLKGSGFFIFFIGLKILFTQIDLIKQKRTKMAIKLSWSYSSF